MESSPESDIPRCAARVVVALSATVSAQVAPMPHTVPLRSRVLVRLSYLLAIALVDSMGMRISE